MSYKPRQNYKFPNSLLRKINKQKPLRNVILILMLIWRSSSVQAGQSHPQLVVMQVASEQTIEARHYLPLTGTPAVRDLFLLTNPCSFQRQK